jgi:phage shock protein PspC (stress-responsive transcriptional regulator)
MENATPPHDVPPGGTPPGAGQPPTPDPQSHRGAGDFSALRRSTTNRYVGGVAGGLARHFDVDPVVVRVLLAVLTLFGGVGLFAYVALWIVVPEEGSDARPLGLDDKSRSVAVIVVGALAVLLALGAAAGRGFDGLWWLWPAAIITGLVLFLNERSRRQPPARPPYGQPPYGQAYGQPPYGQAPPSSSGQPPYGQPAPWSPQAREAGTPDAAEPTAQAATGQDPKGPDPMSPEQPTQQFAQAPYRQGAQAPYQPAFAPQAPYQFQPQAAQPVPPPRPANPRRRGPILFWFTLALVALGIGVLGLIEVVAGVPVLDSAYPAVALGITTLMLLVGSFWGRPGGLIALGLVAALTMGATASVERFEADDVLLRPLTSTSATGEHRFGAGEFVLDLTQVRDLEALDGERISIDGGVGSLEVVLPEGLTADVTGDVGIGGITIDGRDLGGIGTTFDHRISGGPDAPAVDIDIDLGIGQVTVRSE